MKGRNVVVLLAAVVAAAVAAFWFATREPAVEDAPQVPDTTAAAPHAPKPAADAPKRPRAASGPRWIRRGAGTLTGRVREYGTDRALGGIAITVEAGTPGPDASVAVTTAADGSFVVDAIDEFDGWTLRAKAPAPLADAELVGIRVTTGRQTDVGTVYLAPAFAVPGIVVDERGAPVEGADVMAARHAPETGRIDILRILRELAQRPASIDRTTSGADGKFKLTRLVPGTYEVAAQKAGFAHAVEESVLVTPESASQEIRLVLRKGLAAQGRVSRKGGAPVAGATIVAFTEPRGNTFDPYTKGFATTDAAGEFRLDGLLPGRYIVAATPEGEPSVINDKLRIPATAPVEIVLDGDASLEGTVTGPDDKPVAGAQLMVVSEQAMSFGSAVTDENGKYVLRGLVSGSQSALVISAEGLARYPADMSNPFKGKAAGLSLTPGANRKDVKLLGGATVRGTVREQGTGAAAAGVRVQIIDTGFRMGSSRGATTDAAGAFTIAGVSPGTVVLTATKEGWYQPDVTSETMMTVLSSGPTTAPATGAVVVIAEDATAVDRDLEIARTGEIRGRVDAPDGSPAAGAQVSLATEGNTDSMSMLVGTDVEPRVSDATGTFVLPAPAPGRTVRVVAKRYGLAPGRSDPISGAAGADVAGIVIRLRTPAVLEGRVTDAAGKPIDGATIRWTADGSRDARTTATGADGAWRAADLEPAKYALTATHPRYVPWMAKDVIAEEGKSLTLDATLQLGAVVAGTVLGPDGNPVAGAVVDLKSKAKRTESSMDGASDGRDAVVSGADGSFAAEGLATGPYSVQARADGFVASERIDVDAPASSVTLRLAKAFTITGVVRVRGGEPVAGMDVRAQSPSKQPAPSDGRPGGLVRPTITATARTDADGAFVLKGLAEGSYELRVDPDSSRGPRPNVLPVTVPGVVAGRSDVVVEMPPGLVISGTVVRADGSLAPTGRVSADIQRQKGVPNVADGARGSVAITDGHFEIVGLAAGTFDVKVNVEDHAKKELTATSGTTGLRIELFAGGTLQGRALLADGTPAIGATASASGPAGDGWVRTDSEGRYTIRALAEGSYSVQVRLFITADRTWMRGSVAGQSVRDGAATDVPDITCEKQDAPRPVAPAPPTPPK